MKVNKEKIIVLATQSHVLICLGLKTDKTARSVSKPNTN